MSKTMGWKIAAAIILTALWHLSALIWDQPPGRPPWLGPIFGLAIYGFLAWAFLPRCRTKREKIPARIGAGLVFLSMLGSLLCALFLPVWYAEEAGFVFFMLGTIAGIAPTVINELRRAAAERKAAQERKDN